MRNLIFKLIIIFVLLQISCIKTPPEAPGPPTGRVNNLIAYTWGLMSATSIDSLSSGALRNYNGNPSDSVHFLWTFYSNLNISGVCSFIQENKDSIIANIVSYKPASAFTYYDSATIAYDTIITSSPWRPSYSDTLLISKVSRTRLVFQVGYSDSTGTGVEIDSFRNVGHYNPF